MADGGMVKSSADMAPIVAAARGEKSFTSSDVLMPVAKGALAGGLGVTVTRYWGNEWFPEYETDADGNPDTSKPDRNHKLKRGAFKIGVGVVGAGMLRKWSQAAAVGWALACCGDGVADIVEDKATEMLDGWFGDEADDGTDGTGTGTGTGTGARSGGASMPYYRRAVR
jgi:hypothetical protein